MPVWLFVAARIVANPVSNAFQKQLTNRGADPIFIIAATHALLALACLPLLSGLSGSELGAAFWRNMLLCAVLAVSSNVLLVHALKAADLSVIGPINAYKSVVGLVLGILLVGEVPTPAGVAGVLLIVAGSSLVVETGAGHARGTALARFFRERGVQLRLAALVLSATEAAFLKRALLLSSPLVAFIFWSVLGLPIALTAVGMFVRARLGKEIVLLHRNAKLFVLLALMTGIMQLTTLLTFGQMQVGYSLALFQLSTIITVFLGRHYFEEGHAGRRLLAAAIMSAGGVLIVLYGRGN